MDPIAEVPETDEPDQLRPARGSQSESQSGSKLEALYRRALELPVDERDAAVREWSGEDTGLYNELMKLLFSDASLQDRAPAQPATGSRGSGLLARSQNLEPEEEEADPWVGQTLGPYRLERLLGRGGMGVVYLGRRQTGGFAQTVAVKLVARHMRSGPALAQFLMERDALAQLEHKNISRLLDGGVTADGLPYVVMEYIEGRTLDRMCEDPTTSLEKLLQMMIQLCEAVDYVHRNLILHRDLKPGNVMVTTDGAVKLLDFGTVKLIGPAAVDSAMTQAGMRPLTLRYASPEHIMGKPVSTASDIYSLGIILYRLLAGRVPESLEEGRIKPPTEARARELAAGRPAGAPKSPIAPQLAKDLDAIVLKAIRNEPENRYSSAGAMAADITLALTDRPVLARKGTLKYRAGKFYKRHTEAIYAGVAVWVVLSVGLAAMARESFLAKKEQLRAEQGLADEQQLAHALLFDFFEQLKRIEGSTDAQRKTVSEALQYLDGLTTSGVGGDATLEADEVEAYTKMGSLLGSPYEENLGDTDGAIKTLNKAITLGQKMVKRDPDNLQTLRELAAAQGAMGGIYFGDGKPADGLRYLGVATEMGDRIAHDSRATSAMLAQAGGWWDLKGDLYGLAGAVNLGDPAKAVESYEHAAAYDAQGLKLDPECSRCRRGVALLDWKIGMQLLDTDPAKAEAEYRQGLAALATFSPEDQKSARNMRADTLLREKLGAVEATEGKTAESISLLEEVHRRFQEAVAADKIDSRAQFDLVGIDDELALQYIAAGNLQKALQAREEMLKGTDGLLEHDPKNEQWQFHHASALLGVGEVQRKLGNKETGDRMYREGLDLMVGLAEQKEPTAEALRSAADGILQEGAAAPRSPQVALAYIQRSVDMTPKPDVGQLMTLADAKKATGDAPGASAVAARVLQMSTIAGKSTLSPEALADMRGMVH